MLLPELVRRRSRPAPARGAPRRARASALKVADVSTPSRFVHWLAWGMSPRSRGLAAGARPPKQGRNDFGRLGWGGPCPPASARHRYGFVLYVLRRPVELRNGAAGARVR